MKRGDVVRLTIADLDEGGAGVGRAPQAPRDPATPTTGCPPGWDVHVAGALPGENVTARVAALSAHGPTAWGELLELGRASPDRVPPSCAAFGRCGGCVLQHLRYPAQLAWKGSVLRRQVAGHPDLADVRLAAPVASPRALGYRNKSKLVAAPAAGGGVVLGAYAPRSHDVVDLLGCAIAEPPLDDIARSIAEVASRCGVSAYDERRGSGSLRYVSLRASARGQVQITLVTSAEPLARAGDLVAGLRERHPEIVGILQNVNASRGNVIFGPEERTLWGAATLDDSLAGLELRLSSRAFFQANRDVAAAAYRQIARAVDIGADDVAVDAYAGVGGIALTLARRAREVVAIEEHAGAVADGVANAAANGLPNVRFVAGDVVAHLAALGHADVVVLNPPRKGCERRVLEHTAALAPRAIAYLSCAPATLLRDLSALRALGYETRELTPFDMLPHTPHLEVLALLNRAGDARLRAVMDDEKVDDRTHGR